MKTGNPEEGKRIKKEFIFSLILLSLTMISAVTLTTSATDYTKVGVKAGDTAEYVFSTPTSSGELNIHVLQIDGTNVTVNMQETYSNGTEKPYELVTGNLAGFFNLLFPYLVSANLSQGDSAIPNDTLYTISKTLTMNLNGINRTINYLNVTFPLGGLLGTSGLQAYWDRATGLAIKTNETISAKLAALIGTPAGNYINYLVGTTAFATTQPTGNATKLLTIIIGAEITVAATALTITAAAITKHKKPKTVPTKT